MMFEIDLYNREVLRAFQEKKDQEKLTHLQRASRADLMKECLRRLEKGELDSDLPDLTTIFESDGTLENLKTAIKKAGSDRFRPVQDFIQQRTSKPTDNIIILLAIFIDFEPRPFEYWRNIHRTKNNEEKGENTSDKEETGSVIEEHLTKESIIIPNSEGPNMLPHPPINLQKKEQSTINGFVNIPRPKMNNKNILIGVISLLIVIFSIVSYLWIFPDDCMCWNGVNYVKVDCQDKTQRYQVIGLNRDKLNNFKKIENLDTIKLEDIDHIWYSKIDNEYEFFTEPGRHPASPSRSLKATTKYIWETQIKKKSDNNPNGQLGIVGKH
ncbi:hypothetical protein [Sphingobacterium siyangense]|uniref:hypothetical protein n=1 Tax=Sphingobacterium siyangense TaxID=459529 RepID=UPI0019632DA7|nr:hypothetical protein [Sphingobacterium siyangense]QRY57293.1 hypothetical protein JVX97_25415 [Sphingobacterium siyangense]